MGAAHIVALVGLIFVYLAPSRAFAAEPAITQEELVRRTQELFDSIVPGDQKPWQKYYADDCMYNDEKGRSLDKAKLMPDISPMPKGYSGSIKIKNVQSRITAGRFAGGSYRGCRLGYHLPGRAVKGGGGVNRGPLTNDVTIRRFYGWQNFSLAIPSFHSLSSAFPT